MSNIVNKFINGPVNVVRLEGKVGKVDKVIYLFMDIHSDPHSQTECNDLKSVDIRDYLVKNFNQISKSKKTYDFLFEIKPTFIVRKSTKLKGRYVDRITKIFKKEFKLNNKVVSYSNQFPNVRLHFIDIRDYLRYTLSKNLYGLLDYVEDIWRSMSLSNKDIMIIKSTLNLLTSKIRFIYDIIYNGDKRIKKINPSVRKPLVPKDSKHLDTYSEVDYNIAAERIINKILNSYNNKKVKNNLLSFLNNQIKESFDKYFKSVNKFLKYLEKISKKLDVDYDSLYDVNIFNTYLGINYGIHNSEIREMIAQIYNHMDIVYIYWMNLYSDVMDIHFLRRYLDKDYITNGIVYTGIYHSINYIWVLVKFFNFKITHTHYVNDKYQDNLIKSIKKSDKPIDIQKIFYPEKLIQCSNIKKFPDLFN